MMKHIFIIILKWTAVIAVTTFTLQFLFNEDTTRNTGKKVIILDRDTGTVVRQHKTFSGPKVIVIYRNQTGEYIEQGFDAKQVRIIGEVD